MPFHVGSYPAYVGGTAIGLAILGETPALLVQSRVQDQQGPRQGPEDVRWLPSVVAVVPPGDGRPHETGSSAGTRLFSLAPDGVQADAIAVCRGAGDTMCALTRTVSGTGRRSYALQTVATTGPLKELPVQQSWLFEPAVIPPSGNARIAMVGTSLVIASTRRQWLRVTIVARPGTARTTTIALGKVGGGLLRGLIRLTVASVRHWDSVLSIALTADRTDPVAGGVSQGVMARLRIDSLALDERFGEAGLWISPIFPAKRAFVCGAETTRGIAGVAGSRAVAFGVLPDGSALDQTFGVDGVSEVNLAGPLSHPVVTNDRDEFIYVFARRQPDLRIVGCRIRVASGLFPVPNGSHDPNFGVSGRVTLGLDGAPATPAAIAATDFSIVVAATRSIRGSDCDRVPVLAALQRSDGAPDASFGAGGFALHGSIGAPAAFAADGSCLLAGPARVPGVRIRATSPDGGEGRLVEPALGVNGAAVRSMRWLPDGSQLISGEGATGWIAKLTPAGALDASFGNGGVAQPDPSLTEVVIVGVRADGRIAVRSQLSGWPVVGLLQADGAVEQSFGDSGFRTAGRIGDEVRAYQAGDGSVLCVCSTSHTVGEPRTNPLGLVTNEFVQVGLVRITPDGAYDTAFGWGGVPVFPPSARTLTLPVATANAAVDDQFNRVAPAGVAALGGKHYVVATGFVGGRKVRDPLGVISSLPTFPTLVVTRWNADGSPDPTFTAQVGGYAPERRFWTAVGMLTESASSLLAFGSASPRDIAGSPGAAPGQAVPRQPQPALFRVGHPGGIDFAFGQGGAATTAMQEFGPATASAGTVLGDGKIRLAVADLVLRSYRAENDPLVSIGRPDSSFGGLAQFA